MAKKRLNAEQIVTKLRQIEVLQAQGKTIAVSCKEVGTTEQSYYHWRNEYGGLGVDQAKRLKQLETENGRLKKLVADLSLEKQVLQGYSTGKVWLKKLVADLLPEKQVLQDIVQGKLYALNGVGRRVATRARVVSPERAHSLPDHQAAKMNSEICSDRETR